MEDLYDGFFPTKLKGKLNDCTPILLIDKTEELYVPEARKNMQSVHSGQIDDSSDLKKSKSQSALLKSSGSS